ncbi:MAG TPA: MBOAT family O-acyltransferase [Cyclobacteriaceae bacterium]
MLFNSVEFIFIFLPITLAGYFFLTHRHYYRESKIWLFLASLFFYGWWNPKYLVLILTSIIVNFLTARSIARADKQRIKKSILIPGILFNIGLLVYYKYANFFISNFNFALQTDFNLLNIILPLGISFYTFQQIAFLVDSYKGMVKEFDFVYYGAFVTFFPQLISGPISHHKELMPQMLDESKAHINMMNIVKGIFVFNMGLAKKIIIADTFGKIANVGYSNVELLSLPQSWVTSFAYTVQLYFDFSGYSDMAIGLGLLFNINIPVNFRSPHKSESIQQFYRRWHITLSNFMRNYIYIPLGGNQSSEFRTNVNLLLTFLIGGLWHGANWTFVIWGALNGLALVAHRLFQKTKINLNHYLAVGITFLFVMIVRIFFRANEFTTAVEVLKTMFGFKSPSGSFPLVSTYFDAPIWLAGIILLFLPNSGELTEKFKTNYRFATVIILLILVNMVFMNSVAKQDFLYFDF